MYKKIILVSVFILLISLSVSAVNYCKTAPDGYSIYYPFNFNINNIPDNVDCWCSVIDSTTTDPPDIFEADVDGPWPFGQGFGTLALPMPPYNPFNSIILKSSQRFGWTHDVPLNTTLNINRIKERTIINAKPWVFDPIIAPPLEVPIISTVHPPVDVEISLLSGRIIDTIKHSYACDFEQSCYNYNSRQLCKGAVEIPGAYQFNDLGIRRIKIYAYTINDADPDSRLLAADFTVNVVSDYVEGTPPYETPPHNFCRENTRESGGLILPMGVYYPDGFNPLDIPAEKQCWCNQDTQSGAKEAIYHVTFAELVPPAGSNQETIQIQNFNFTGVISPGTVLNIKNIQPVPNIHSQVHTDESDNMLVQNIVPGLDVVILKDDLPEATITNSLDCGIDARQSCYNNEPSRRICVGQTEIPNAYTFQEEGEYTVQIMPYRLNNGDNSSAEIAATLNITVSASLEPLADPPECGNGMCEDGEDYLSCPDDCTLEYADPPASTQGLLVISNSNPLRIIEVNNNTDEVTILWTLTNTGDAEVLITSVNPHGCTDEWKTPNRVGTCEFVGDLSNHMINGKSNFLVFEKIKITDFSKIPNMEIFGLSVTYTDGENEKTVTTTAENTVTLSYALSERRKFQIELLAGTPRYCLGGDGQVGGTGKGMAPRVKFDWDWSSWAGIIKEGEPAGTSNIGKMMSCDKEGPNDTKFYFCDPTQFTITVMEKLMLLEKVIEEYQDTELIEGKGQGEELVTYLTQFQVYIIGDNYNDDFKKDFVSYYRADYFSSTPDEFYNLWYKYLYYHDKPSYDEGPVSRIKFINKTYDNWSNPPEWFDEKTKTFSGLYNVRINVTFDEQHPGKFFISDEPLANVKVTLTKSPEYTAPLNPLYFMPFNGNVGIYPDGDGRVGYGMSYTLYDPNMQPLILTEKYPESFELRSGSSNDPLYTVETEIRNTFEEVNQTNRGALLTIKIADAASVESGAADGTIIFSPSKATPVFASAISDEDEAAFYYYITRSGVPLSDQSSAGADGFITPALPGQSSAVGDAFTTYWSGDAATYNCADFEGKNLPLNRTDSKPYGTKCTSNLTIDKKESAFGFKWSDFNSFEPDPKIVMFHTIFYTPDDPSGEVGHYKLHNACRGNLEDTSSIFIAPTERNTDGVPASGVWIGNEDNRVIPLEYSSLNTENTDGTKTIQQVFDLIEEERACLTVENTGGKFEMKVWWNPAKLIDETSVWWRNEVRSGTGFASSLNKYLKEQQLQTCGRT